jgi:hypothetical protein
MDTILIPIVEALLGVRGLLLSLLLLILIVVKEFVQAAGGTRARFWSGLLAAAIVPLLLAFGLTVALRLEANNRSHAAQASFESSPAQATQEHRP